MNDDDLILYYFDDGLDDAQRERIRARLDNDAAMAARYGQLCSTLDALQGETVAAPPHLAPRWHDLLDQVANREARDAERGAQRQRWVARVGWGAAIAATLALGIGIGTFLDRTQPAAPGVVDTGPAELPAGRVDFATPALARGLQVYLREARADLQAVPADSDAERMLLIRDIIRQNRLFETAAEQQDAAKLARVLRAFEPILLQLAAEDIAAEDAEALSRKLSFELGVTLTKLDAETSKQAETI